jgi:hypothetical protein
MSKKEIIYPFLLNCVSYCPDGFWSSIFEDLAYGRPPNGTYISKNFLNYKQKDTGFCYKIEDKPPHELYEEIYTLLKNNANVLSKNDIMKTKLEFQTQKEKLKDSRQQWANIRKKNIKDLLIEQYVVRMKKEYLLNIKQARKLKSTISIAMVFKVITKDDITFENGSITKINGITFKKRKIIENMNIVDKSSQPDECPIETKKMIDNWEKFLKALRKIKI